MKEAERDENMVTIRKKNTTKLRRSKMKRDKKTTELSNKTRRTAPAVKVV